MDFHILKGSGKLCPSSLPWYLCQLCICCRVRWHPCCHLLFSPAGSRGGLRRWWRAGWMRGGRAGCLCSEPALKCWGCVGAVGHFWSVVLLGGLTPPSAKGGGVQGQLHGSALTCPFQESGNILRMKLVLDGDMSPELSAHPAVFVLGEGGSWIIWSRTHYETHLTEARIALAALSWCRFADSSWLLLFLAHPFPTWPFFSLGSFVYLGFCFYWTV